MHYTYLIQYLFLIEMYKVMVQFLVKGQVSNVQQFACDNISKDFIQRKIQNLSLTKIDRFELAYYDFDDDQITLSEDDDYKNVEEMFNLNLIDILIIVAKTDEYIEWNKEKIKQVKNNIELLRKNKDFLDSKNEYKRYNKGNLKAIFNTQIAIQKHIIHPQTKELYQKIEETYPKISNKQKKRLKKEFRKSQKLLVKDELRILSKQNKQKSKDRSLLQKKGEISETIIEKEVIENDQNSDTFQEDDNLDQYSGKDSIKILNYLAKLKRNIKQQIIAQLPNYIKKQCFSLIPNKVNKIAQEPVCFSCQKNLKELPLPIYINNKNEFYCCDCEECLAEDDELLVKIKSEALRQQIFMVKCVPILRSDIQHLQSVRFRSKQQKYEEIVRFAKKIAISKLNNFIFKQQQRNIIHNRLMMEQERNKFYENCKKRKYANLEHKMNQIKVKNQMRNTK